MNDPAPWFSIVLSWTGSLATISWNQAVGLLCAAFSIVASYYAIKVSRARLKKLEEGREKTDGLD